MAKQKKKRCKKYRPRSELGVLLGGAQFTFSTQQLEDAERSMRVHAAVLRTEPAEASWLYVLGTVAILWRLSQALEGEEVRRLMLAAWRQTFTAFRHWQSTGEVLTTNLEALEEVAEIAPQVLKSFTIFEYSTGKEWMETHGVEPPSDEEAAGVQLAPRIQGGKNGE